MLLSSSMSAGCMLRADLLGQLRRRSDRRSRRRRCCIAAASTSFSSSLVWNIVADVVLAAVVAEVLADDEDHLERVHAARAARCRTPTRAACVVRVGEPALAVGAHEQARRQRQAQHLRGEAERARERHGRVHQVGDLVLLAQLPGLVRLRPHAQQRRRDGLEQLADHVVLFRVEQVLDPALVGQARLAGGSAPRGLYCS